MGLKRIFKTGLLCLFLLTSINAELAEGLNRLNLLEHIVTEQEEDATVFRLEFQRPVSSYKAPIFFKKSIQVDFKGSFIKPSKRDFYTGDLLISRIYAAQFTPNIVRVRFVLGGKRNDIRENFHLSKEGRFLVVRIDKTEPDILEKLLRRISERDEVGAKELATTKQIGQSNDGSSSPGRDTLRGKASASATLANFGKEESRPANKLNMIGDKKTFKFLNSQGSQDVGPPDLMSSGITMFSMLAIVLALMFFIFYLFKKFVLKNGLLGGNGKLIKVLETGMIAPRKTIALVEVAGEVLVLGISNDHIALLSTIRDKRTMEEIKKQNFSPEKLSSAFGFKNDSNGSDVQDVGNSALEFKKYFKQFGEDRPTKEQSIAGVKAAIRKNLRKMKTA